MKIRLFLFLFLWASIKSWSNTDSTNFIHSFKKDGPTAIQIIWIDNSNDEVFLKNSLLLEAALVGGTRKYDPAKFKSISDDYRIEWETESAAGMHRLSLSFAQLKYDLAMEMLDEVLNKTAFGIKTLNTWKKDKIYDYNYYKNDPDTLIKWWANGKEAYYESLAKINLSSDSSSLIELLGNPQIVSSVGRLNEIFFKKELSKIVKTEPKTHNNEIAKSDEFSRARPSINSFSAASIEAENPIVAYFLLEAVKRNNDAKINSSQYSWMACKGVFTIERNQTLTANPDGKKDEFYWERAITAYYLWIEYNKNQALAAALVELGLWEKELDKKEAINASLDKGWGIRTYFLGE